MTFKSTSWIFFNPKSMKVVGIWQWLSRFQGNISSLSSDICCAFFCHVGGKHSLFQVTVARDYHAQFPKILQVPETCLGPSVWNFHSCIIQTFICLKICTWTYRLTFKRYYFVFLRVDSKLQCHQFYCIVHLIPYLLYLHFQLFLYVLLHAILYSCHELILTFLYY